MSRVDEALKRARGRASGVDVPEGATTDLHAVTSPVVPSWQYERFPVEGDAADPRARAGTPRIEPSSSPAGVMSEDENRGASPVSIRYVTRGVAPQFAEKIVGGATAMPSREQYGRVAAVLHQAQRQQKTKIVMIASAVPGEGKTLTAANVALTMAESYGRRVLLIDADLRKPTLHQLFQVPGAKGLLDGLEAGDAQAMALIQVTPRLSVLPAGSATTDPMRLLVSERMRQVLNEAAQAFDWVIVDTPPIALVPDAHVLADMVHAAILVIRAGSTPHDLISDAVNTLGRPRVLGAVLNCVDANEMAGGRGQYGYGYAYGRA
jgi:protein-tyrosine kinase